MKTIYLAGGCFWCIEYFFRKEEGIINVTSGYSGGEVINPTYEMVKSQTTKHRESIKIDFDEHIISLEKIIDIYFAHVDPYDKEGQYGDIGYSYTLAMYYQNEEEKNIYARKLDELKNKVHQEIYIALEPFKNFYPAEEYHQNYACKNPKKFKEELINSKREK